jgi:hypothetical protein
VSGGGTGAREGHFDKWQSTHSNWAGMLASGLGKVHT